MLNKLIICNQGPAGIGNSLELRIKGRILTVELHKKSILKIKPDLYCYIVNNKLQFQEYQLNCNYAEIVIQESEYKSHLKEYLENTFIPRKIRDAASKMDLLRTYLTINDKEKAQNVLDQMKCTGNVKMLNLIFKKIQTDKKNAEKSENYNKFIENCNEIDYHSAYIFAFDTIKYFKNEDLFRLPESLEKIYLEKDLTDFKLDVHDQSILYDLSVLLMVKIAIEFSKRDCYRLAGAALVLLASKLNNIMNRHMVIELLSLAFTLLNNLNSQFVSCLENDVEFGFHLTPAQLFYIQSRFNIENRKLENIKAKYINEIHQNLLKNSIYTIEHKKPYEITISSHCDVFNFNVIKKTIQDAFVDKISIRVVNKDGVPKEILGVIEKNGDFYQANNTGDVGIIYPEMSIDIGFIILKDGQQIKKDFKMNKIIRRRDIELIDVKIVKGEEFESINVLKPQLKYKLVIFKFKNDKCNYSFADIIYQKEVNGNIQAFFDIDVINMEVNVEIDNEIFESRVYYI
jgi:hypothetical protein